ncbi:hypothetical protein DINM_007236 [Dirofilaria immitis]|nr:hypothetical protein [Dirofilaria immitis]
MIKFAQEIQERNDKVIKDGEEAIRHPINASLLIEETTGYLKKVVKIMQSNSANGRSVRRSNWFVTFARYISNEYQGCCRRKILNSQMRTVALTDPGSARTRREDHSDGKSRRHLEYLPFSLYKQSNLKQRYIAYK